MKAAPLHLRYSNNFQPTSKRSARKRYHSLKSGGSVVDILDEFCVLTDLTCLAYIIQRLIVLNLELQGSYRYVAGMISTINAFRSKLLLSKSHLDKKCLCVSQHRRSCQGMYLVILLRSYTLVIQNIRTMNRQSKICKVRSAK